MEKAQNELNIGDESTLSDNASGQFSSQMSVKTFF